ncbi:MAG: F0F1 ATP synthase subunit delta [Thermochromatium sp.]
MAKELTTIARPYAEAAFAHAKESGQVDAWSEALRLLATVAADPDLAAQIDNPTVPRERIRDLLLDLCGPALPATLANLVRLLADNGRLVAIPEIARLFEERRIADQGVRYVLVRSAFEVEDAQRSALATALARRLNARVELTFEIDPALIGGLEIHAGDLVIDHSVRGKIKQLAHALQF